MIGEPLTLWLLIALLATALFSTMARAFMTLLSVEPQVFEEESKTVLSRIHEHWPRELAVTMAVYPFIAMTATLVLGGMRFRQLALVTQGGASLNPWRSILIWLALTFLVLVVVNSIRSLGSRYPATIMQSLGWIYIPAFFLFYPLSYIFGPLFSRLRLGSGFEIAGPVISAREIQDFVAHEGGEDILEEDEREMISSIIDLRDTPVREVMIPRIDIKALDVETPFSEVRKFVAGVGHSRVPVYKDSIDHVVGILYSKDLLRFKESDEQSGLMKAMRKPYFIPETKMVGDLLRRFQNLRQHIAVVVDEYGGTAGIVTLEDLLEEIVGEIHDEHDKEEHLFELIDDHTARVDAKIDLEELEDTLGHNFDTAEEDFESLGGLLLYHSGRILSAGDELSIEPFLFRIESVQRQRIAKVIMIGPDLGTMVKENSKTPEQERES